MNKKMLLVIFSAPNVRDLRSWQISFRAYYKDQGTSEFYSKVFLYTYNFKSVLSAKL